MFFKNTSYLPTMSFYAIRDRTEWLARASGLPGNRKKSIINVPSSQMLQSHKIIDWVSSVDANVTDNWYDGTPHACVQTSATVIHAGWEPQPVRSVDSRAASEVRSAAICSSCLHRDTWGLEHEAKPHFFCRTHLQNPKLIPSQRASHVPQQPLMYKKVEKKRLEWGAMKKQRNA